MEDWNKLYANERAVDRANVLGAEMKCWKPTTGWNRNLKKKTYYRNQGTFSRTQSLQSEGSVGQDGRIFNALQNYIPNTKNAAAE